MKPWVPVALALCCAGPALGASPTVWDRARDPRAVRAARLERGVHGLVARALASDPDPSLAGDFTAAALALLDVGRADLEGNAELERLYGHLLIQASRGLEARGVLSASLARDGEGSSAPGAWFDLGVACALLDDARCEIDAYDHALDLESEASARAGSLSNRAEARMRVGDLEGAVADYREALVAQGSPLGQALAYYGLAVALVRSGDVELGLEAARSGNSVPPESWGGGSALAQGGVFFVPAYDVHFYAAIQAIAEATRADDPDASAAAWAAAIVALERYLPAAEADGSPWLAVARHRLSDARRKLSGLRPRLKPRAATERAR